MNYLANFKEFYLRTVLPNTPSYSSLFGVDNFDKKIDILIDIYKKSYGNDPFVTLEVDSGIAKLEENLKKDDTDFSIYSRNAATDVPKYILLTHFIKFLRYFNTSIKFNNFQEFVNRIHQDIDGIGKKENFIKKFRETRKIFAEQSRIVKPELLFGEVRDDYWTINVGAEKEIQYHIHLDDSGFIKYGLGFNIQASSNNRDPVSCVFPFKDSFYSFRSKIDKILQDYYFIDEDEDNLKNLIYGKFVLYGYKIPFSEDSANYIVQGLDYLKILYDLRNKQFKAWKLIFENSKQKSNQLENTTSMNEYINLLEYKKQIILQGPPGTGKTKLAKEIVEKIISNEINDNLELSFLKAIIKPGTIIKSAKGFVDYVINKVDDLNVNFLNSEKKSQTKSFQNILENYNNGSGKGGVSYDGKFSVDGGFYKFINEEVVKMKLEKQSRILQFHPSYTYEDFVRGIVAKPSGNGITYEAQNKLLAKFANDAFKNWEESKTSKEVVSYKTWVESQFPEFVEHVSSEMEKGSYLVSDNVGVIDISEDAFRYTGINYQWGNIHRMAFRDIIQGFIDNASDRGDLKRNPNVSGSAKQHSTYFIKMVNDFRTFLEKENKKYNESSDAKSVNLKNYVLIIDEINRANLSSVLGELIYALEYRGEEVDSMYEVDGSEKLVLPPNLYIIGTMNTADRSVGHIDYAIRRRFAFVDVLPKDLSGEDGIQFDSVLFNSVKALFTTDDYTTRSQYLSNEFEPKDVALGHSYFIDKSKDGGNMKIRLEYEIKPILREYVKDGVLIGEKILDIIEKLEASI